MNLEEFLKREETILISEKRQNTKIVIASPHHAPGGITQLPCTEHSDSDENAGIIARKIAEKINASSIIACNYHIDSNKSLKTDYSIQITKWNPDYLIEIHGHSGTKTNPKNVIEISAGSEERNELSIGFADKLMDKLKLINEFKNIPVNGDFTNIFFKAKNTATITYTKWKALHIELPPILRKEGNNLPKNTDEFIKLLSATIIEICI
jgi:hypothetical protein